MVANIEESKHRRAYPGGVGNKNKICKFPQVWQIHMQNISCTYLCVTAEINLLCCNCFILDFGFRLMTEKKIASRLCDGIVLKINV